MTQSERMEKKLRQLRKSKCPAPDRFELNERKLVRLLRVERREFELDEYGRSVFTANEVLELVKYLARSGCLPKTDLAGNLLEMMRRYRPEWAEHCEKNGYSPNVLVCLMLEETMYLP